MNQVRQGDVLLVRVSKLPPQAKPVGRKGAKRIILAEGEATGHAHAIETDTAKLLEDALGRRFLIVTKAEQLVHEEHDTLRIEPGIWRVVRQQEYIPDEQKTRRVRD